MDQHTWAAAKAQLAADAIAVAVEAESIERPMLLSVDLPLVLDSLEHLLGGEGGATPSERHLSEIDWVLARGLLDAIVDQLARRLGGARRDAAKEGGGGHGG